MHPYRIRTLLRERGKDELLALKLSSLYHAIDRLLEAQLIETAGTMRDGRRPERTTYRINAAGEAALTKWLRNLIADPKPVPSEFMACISFLVYLSPQEAMAQLETRAARLAQEIVRIEGFIESMVNVAGRINLIEDEYRKAMLQAEMDWIRGVVAEIRVGSLDWNLEEILAFIRAAKAGRGKAKRTVL